MSNTALHSETLARLGLLRPLSEYEESTQPVTDVLTKARLAVKASKAGGLAAQSRQVSDPFECLAQAAESQINGLEFFSLLRQP